jgi:putative modified peptide
MDELEITITIRMSSEQAAELMRRLAEDDDFRNEVQKDPASVLERYGISISPPEAIPPNAQLASKEEVAVLIAAMAAEDDPFGRVSHGAWSYHVLPYIFSFGAIPMFGRGDES